MHVVEEPVSSVPVSLEDRIFALINDQVSFCHKDLKGFFPMEADKNLYRAIKKLESESRIRFLFYRNKAKHYTTVGVSQLPSLAAADGNVVSLAVIFKNIAQLFDEQGRYIRLVEVNDLLINFCRLFLIAQMPEGKEKRQAYFTVHRNIQKQMAVLKTLLGYCESVLKHPTMSGDLKYFTEVFAGSEAPTANEMTEFKLWVTKLTREEAERNGQD